MSATDAATFRGKGDPFRGHGWRFCTPHDVTPPKPRPKRLCKVCGAKLARDNAADQCSCHDYGQSYQSAIELLEDHPSAVVLVEAAGDMNAAERVERSLSGEALPATYRKPLTNAARDAEWYRLSIEDGVFAREIAAEYDESESTVYHALRRYAERHGLPRVSQQRIKARAQQARVWADLHRCNNWSYEAIGQQWGVLPDTVRKRIERLRDVA